jgi:hypothetical protein
MPDDIRRSNIRKVIKQKDWQRAFRAFFKTGHQGGNSTVEFRHGIKGKTTHD